jgi:hypothetical protein
MALCKSRASREKPGFFRLLRRRGRLHQPAWPDEKNALVVGAGSQRLAEPAAGKQRNLLVFRQMRMEQKLASLPRPANEGARRAGAKQRGLTMNVKGVQSRNEFSPV